MATLLEISNPTLRVPTTPFKNEPLTEFSTAQNARKMKAALTKVRAELGREYDKVIGNRLVKTYGEDQDREPGKAVGNRRRLSERGTRAP